MRSDVRVLVVGAGPTGLTAAIELCRRGVSVRLVERRQQASGLSRAVGFQPASLALLQPSGAARDIQAESIAYQSMVVHSQQEPLLEVAFTRSEKAAATLHGLAQDRTEFHLRTALEAQGGRVDFGEELVRIQQKANRVIATTRLVDSAETHTEEFDYLVGADGVDSTVRSLLELDFDGYDLPGNWSIADIDCTDWNTRNLNLYLLAKGQLAVVAPMEANRVRIVASTSAALQQLPVPINVVKVRRESDFRISVRQVAEYRVGRVFLAGDAAHCHSPVGGRGMNLGVADAAALAARLSVDNPDGYQEARHRAARAVINGSERTRKLLTSRNRAVRTLVESAFRTIDRYDFLQRRAADRMLGL